MSGALEGRVAVITGAGRGLGRDHALLFAREGARVVVNDLGGGIDGTGADVSAAQAVVDEIRALGGEAVANTDSVSDWDGAKRLIETAVQAFGGLDVLVNNAGILRDRMFVNMDEDQWDAVIDVHLKGTFCPTRHAAAYWRDKAKADGHPVSASVVCTSSGAGLANNVGQANYGAAKAGIASFAQILAKELERYGVRVNAIAPIARTRLTLQTPGMDGLFQAPDQPGVFDTFDAANISPLVGYLASEACAYTGGIWHVLGGQVGLYEGWRLVAHTDAGRRWEIAELAQEVPLLLSDRKTAADQLLSEGHGANELLVKMGIVPEPSRTG